MDKATAIRFIERKGRLLAEQMPAQERGFFERENAESLELARNRRVTARRMSDFDHLLEVLREPEAGFDWEIIDRALMAEFGFVRLGQDPLKICQRVLKRVKYEVMPRGDRS